MKGYFPVPRPRAEIDPSPLRKSSSIKDLTQTETPWESVTLNRCLFVAITILVITSGFQKLHGKRRKKTRDDSEEVDAKKKLTEKNGSLEETEDNVNEEEKKEETSINSKSQMKKEKTKVRKV
ncbi:unnamed protein product [Merluccius merluccius]